MEIGRVGYKMDIEKEHLQYLLEQRIKSLNGTKSIILEGKVEIKDTLADINNKIQALTNMLEML